MTGIIGNDKAIEFQSTLLKVRKMLNSLESIGLDISPYEEILESIEQESKNIKLHDDNTSLFSSDIVGMDYTKLISKLQELETRLHEYEIYFKSFNYVDSISPNPNYTGEELDIIASNVIYLLCSINSSKTRIYKTEKEVVEKLYGFAYKIIKLELCKRGSSKVLEWCRHDYIATNFINHEVEKELAELSKDEANNPLLKECIARQKAKGLEFSYLDEAIILNLNIQNNDELLNAIKNELLGISRTLQDNASNFDSNKWDIEALDKNIKREKHDFRYSIIYDSIKFIASVSLITSIIFGAYKLARYVTKIEYLDTKQETYSTFQITQTKTEDGYLPKISSENAYSDDEKIITTQIIEYGPWEKPLFGDYSRDIYTYDVSNINYDNLKDYLSLDLESLGYEAKSDTEAKEVLSPEDLYDELIREVKRTTQELDDSEIRHECFVFVLIFIEFVALLLLLLIEELLDESNFSSLLQNIDNILFPEDYKRSRKEIKKMGSKLQSLLEENKKIILENERLRNRFIELYSKYAPFLNNSILDKTYKNLTRKKD